MRHARRAGAVVGLTVVVLAGPMAAQSGVRRDGRWDVTMESNYGGRALKSTITQCITKEQSADPMSTLPGGPEAQQGCRMSDYKVEGPTVTWTVSCQGPPPARTRGEYVYKADSYVGVMTMERAGQTITTRLSGKRLGDCTPPVTPRSQSPTGR